MLFSRFANIVLILIVWIFGNNLFAHELEHATPDPRGDYEPMLSIGRGDIETVEWHPIGEQVLISTRRGSWLYDDQLQEIAASDIALMTYSPDGLFAAGANPQNQIVLQDVATGENLGILYAHEQPVLAVVWSPLGDKIASLDEAGFIIVHSFTHDAADKTFWLPSAVEIAWSRGGTYLAGRTHEGQLNIWDSVTGFGLFDRDQIYQTVENRPPLTTKIEDVVWRNDNEFLIWGYHPDSEFQQYTITQLWSLEFQHAYDNLRTKDLLADDLNYIVDKTGNRVFGISSYKGIAVYDLTQNQPGQMLFKGLDSLYKYDGDWWVRAAALSLNERWLAVGNVNFPKLQSYIYYIDLHSGMIAFKMRVQKDIERLVWSPDASSLLIVCVDGTIQLRHAKLGYFLGKTTDFTHIQSVVAMSEDGAYFAAADTSNQIRVWETQTGTLLTTLAGHTAPITELAWQPGGHLLASRTGKYDLNYFITDGKAHIWRPLATNPVPVASIDFAGEAIVDMSWNHDGTRLAALNKQGNLKIIDSTHGQLILDTTLVTDDFWGRYDTYLRIEWYPDNNAIFTNTLNHGSSPMMRRNLLWQATNGSFLGEIQESSYADMIFVQDKHLGIIHGQYGHPYTIAPYMFSLITSSNFIDKAKSDLDTEQTVLDVFPNSAKDALFSPNGTALAGWDVEAHAMVWDMPSGKLRLTLNHAEKLIWSSDGHQLAVLNNHEPIQIIDAYSGEVLDTLSSYEATPYGRYDKTQVFWSADSQQIVIVNDGVAAFWR